MAVDMQEAKATKPNINLFETRVWMWMRLSGLLIIPFVFIHLFIMHLAFGVHEITYEWVIEERWAYVGWRIFDAFLLWFAGAHGLFGFRNVMKDYVRGAQARRVVFIIAAIVMGLVLFAGSIALLGAPFEPVPGISGPH